MEISEIAKKVKEAKEKSPSRKFTQSIELGINFKNINLESPEYKLNLMIYLPKGRGKDVEIGVFADGDMNLRAKKISKHVLNRNEIESYSKDRRKMRKFANACYAFIAQPELMSLIGKSWGIILGPRGKMPQPVPSNADLEPVIKRLKNSVRIRSKKNPTVHVPVGSEDMKDEDIAENILAVLSAIEKKIAKENIRSTYVKTTMGPAVRLW